MKLLNTAQGKVSQFVLYNYIFVMIKQLNMGLTDKVSRLELAMNWWENLKICDQLVRLGMNKKTMLQWILK